MESAIASSVFRSPCTFSSHHIVCVLQQTSYYSLLRSSLLSRLICKTRTQSRRKWQPLPGPGLCRIPLSTYSFTPDSLFTYTVYVSCTTLVITVLQSLKTRGRNLRPQVTAPASRTYHKAPRRTMNTSHFAFSQRERSSAFKAFPAVCTNEIKLAARVLSRYRDARRTRILRIRLRLTVRVKKAPPLRLILKRSALKVFCL